MLTFFRKIRRSLIEWGYIRKYLLYAIGEIILVVIGILIALQINNWNEGNKDRQVEKQILENIVTDLKEDTVHLTQRIRLSQREYAALKNYIQKSYDIQQSSFEYRSLLHPIEFNVENLVLQDKTYRDITNNGKLDLIQAVSLKNEISKYYRLYDIKAAIIKEQNETALSMISQASIEAPILKYAFTETEMMEDIFTDPQMFDEEEWAFINFPKSKAFKLWEETTLYYAFKNQVAIGHYVEIKSNAINLLNLITRGNDYAQ
jgi:hypothetical protein